MNHVIKYFFTIVVAGVLFTGCGRSSSTQIPDQDAETEYAINLDYDSTGEIDMQQTSSKSSLTPLELEDARLIREFYGRCVFNGNCEDDYAREHCSSSMLSRLGRAYTEKTGTKDGYGYWIFRTDAEDGNGESTVLRVTPSGNGWYQVDLLDKGSIGSVNVYVSAGKISDLS